MKDVDRLPPDLARAARQMVEQLERAGVTHLPLPPRGSARHAAMGTKVTALPQPQANAAPQREAAIRPAPLPQQDQAVALANRRPASTPPAALPPSAAGGGFDPGAVPSPAVTPPTEPSRAAALAAVANKVAQCTRCQELAARRTQTVFGVGNPHARLVFLGEAPGADEDRQGIPFVGRAGQLLTDMIVKGMRLRREDVYILNILRCRPPENRTPLPQEAANCREYLDAQLSIIQPEFIFCLGACAAHNLLGVSTPIGQMRGRFYDYRGAKVLCTYHPAYLLRNPSMKRHTWEDLQLLMKAMGLPQPAG